MKKLLLLLPLLLPLNVGAVKISDLPAATQLNGTDEFPINQGGTSKKFEYTGETHFLPGATQAAIQTALSAGGTVVLHAGTYSCTMGASDYCWLMDADNTHLILQEGAILQLANSQIDSDNPGNVIQIGDGTTGVNYVTISGKGTVDGNRANNAGLPQSGTPANEFHESAAIGVVANGQHTHITIRGINVINAVSQCVDVNATDASTRNSYITVSDIFCDNSGEGIQVRKTNYALIENNFISNTYSQDGLETVDTAYAIVTGNFVTATTQGCIDVFFGSTFSEYTNNTCISTPGGIAIGGTDGTTAVSDILVSGNTVTDTDYYSINTLQSTAVENRISIIGNHVSFADGTVNSDCIKLWSTTTDAIVSGNVITNCDGAGIDFRATRSVASDNVITNVGIDGTNTNDYGIILQTSDGAVISGNTISDIQGTKTMDYGIYVFTSNVGALVDGNTINGTADHGLYVQSDGTVIANNTLVDPAQDVAAKSGIFVDASNCSITNNKLTNPGASANFDWGIRVNNGDNKILGNQITNTTTGAEGIIIAAGDDSILMGNIIEASGDGIEITSGRTGTTVNGNVIIAGAMKDNGTSTVITNNRLASGPIGSPTTQVYQINYEDDGTGWVP